MGTMHRHLLAYSLGDEHLGGDRKPFNWQKRTGQPAPSLAELIAWDATCDIMILARCPVLRVALCYRRDLLFDGGVPRYSHLGPPGPTLLFV